MSNQNKKNSQSSEKEVNRVAGICLLMVALALLPLLAALFQVRDIGASVFPLQLLLLVGVVVWATRRN